MRLRDALAGALAAVLVGLVPAALAMTPEAVSFDGGDLAPRLIGYLYRPPQPGPRPAVVLLHGCSGLRTERGALTRSHRAWGEWFAGRGYAALFVDSFGPRGYREICTLSPRPILPQRERVGDAYAALEFLRALPDVDPRRVFLVGWSNGGASSLHAMDAARPGRGFRAAVAYYPGCAGLRGREPAFAPYAPLLILAGEADDWTPAQPCRDLVARSRAQGARAEIVTFPGAHHAFDRIGLATRFRADVRNLNSPSGWGATVGSHPQARADSLRRVEAFLEANGGQPGR